MRVVLGGLAVANLLFLVGFALHTDRGENLFLGKYSPSYALFLALLLAPLPFLPRAVRSLSRVTYRQLPGGKSRAVGPRRKVASLCMCIIVALVVVESVCQVRRALKPTNRPPEYLFGFHPFLQMVPDAFRYDGLNRYGFRARDLPCEKAARTFRVFCLGGSTTFCPFLKFEESYPRRLEKILIEKFPGRDIQVWNAGMSYFTSQHSLINYLIRVQEFKPDLVVVSHAINDLVRSFRPPQFCIPGSNYRSDYSNYLGPLAGMYRDLLRQREPTLADASAVLSGASRLFSRCFLSDLRQARLNLAPWEVREFQSLPAFRRNLRNLCDLLRDQKVPLLLATQPFLYRADLTEQDRARLRFPREQANDGERMASVSSMMRGMELFNSAAAKIALEKEVAFLDLEKAVPKTLVYFSDDVHYTAAGAEAVARAVADGLLGKGLLKKP